MNHATIKEFECPKMHADAQYANDVQLHTLPLICVLKADAGQLRGKKQTSTHNSRCDDDHAAHAIFTQDTAILCCRAPRGTLKSTRLFLICGILSGFMSFTCNCRVLKLLGRYLVGFY